MKNYLNRDGVSEGQFYQVLLYELDAIRKVKIDILLSFFIIFYYIEQIQKNYVVLIHNYYTGLCFSWTKLSTTSDFHCGTKTTSHSIIC